MPAGVDLKKFNRATTMRSYQAVLLAFAHVNSHVQPGAVSFQHMHSFIQARHMKLCPHVVRYVTVVIWLLFK